MKIPDYLEQSFTENFSYVDKTKTSFRFYTVDIGSLTIVEGKIIACDPFLYNGEISFTNVFPLGRFPVELAIAKINDDERIGFSRINFSAKSPSRWTMAVTPDQDIASLQPGEIFGYGVDSGTGCFMDVSAATRFLDFLKEDEEHSIDITDNMEATYKNTRSWLVWEKDGFNVAMFSTGWGDGFYASYIGFDSDDKICRLVSDFGLLDWEE
ncbi:DUF4241 domain-containing protein [Terrimonas alba]|uniref:DUF4241 domain-containing protein n=1 Tax=Terrimonas alba TaxID=3349636 RepID=UPI0035F2DC9E